MARALRSGRRGRRFKSCLPDFCQRQKSEQEKGDSSKQSLGLLTESKLSAAQPMMVLRQCKPVYCGLLTTFYSQENRLAVISTKYWLLLIVV